MLRTDGKFEIYTLEFALKKPRPDSSYDNNWHLISFDAAWVPPELYKSKQEVWEEFSASGKCWQETGVHGTYDVETAIKLYCILNQHALEKEKYKFRVVKTTIWQDSEVLWSG